MHNIESKEKCSHYFLFYLTQFFESCETHYKSPFPLIFPKNNLTRILLSFPLTILPHQNNPVPFDFVRGQDATC